MLRRAAIITSINCTMRMMLLPLHFLMLLNRMLWEIRQPVSLNALKNQSWLRVAKRPRR